MGIPTRLFDHPDVVRDQWAVDRVEELYIQAQGERLHRRLPMEHMTEDMLMNIAGSVRCCACGELRQSHHDFGCRLHRNAWKLRQFVCSGDMEKFLAVAVAYGQGHFWYCVDPDEEIDLSRLKREFSDEFVAQALRRRMREVGFLAHLDNARFDGVDERKLRPALARFRQAQRLRVFTRGYVPPVKPKRPRRKQIDPDQGLLFAASHVGQ